jgi:hypothetical protein
MQRFYFFHQFFCNYASWLIYIAYRPTLLLEVVRDHEFTIARKFNSPLKIQIICVIIIDKYRLVLLMYGRSTKLRESFNKKNIIIK